MPWSSTQVQFRSEVPLTGTRCSSDNPLPSFHFLHIPDLIWLKKGIIMITDDDS